jgi:hypothetical protein
MERRAEIAFQRDRDREGGGLSRQLACESNLLTALFGTLSTAQLLAHCMHTIIIEAAMHIGNRLQCPVQILTGCQRCGGSCMCF